MLYIELITLFSIVLLSFLPLLLLAAATFTFVELVLLSVACSWHGIIITACAVATSCCISDVSSQWEGAIFDPP